MCSACCGGASGRTFPSRGCDGCPAPRAGGLLTQCVRYRPCLGAWSCRGPSQVETCHVVSRPYPGRGSRLSLRESPDAKSRRGEPPAPPIIKAARCSLAPSFGIETQQSGRGFYRNPCTGPDLETFFWENIFWLDFSWPCTSVCQPTPPSPPSRGAGRCQRVTQGRRPGYKKAGYPEGYPKPEWGVQRGEALPSGVLSSISHRRNGGRRQASPRGAAPRGW